MKQIHPFPFLIAALFFASCGGGKYSTDFPPPTGDEKYADIFPAEIGGEVMAAEFLDLDAERYHGAIARYGTGASILMLQVKDQESLDSYVKETEIPKLESYSNRASGKINGRWGFRAKGTPGRVRGWQNGQWLFVVRAENDELFDEAVSKFPYIGMK